MSSSDENPAETPAVVERSEVTIRRAPRFGAFLFVGGAAGAIATLIATSLFEVDPAVGFVGTFGYLLLYGVPAGLLVGAIVALIIDAGSRRRARTAIADHEVTGNPVDDDSDDVDDATQDSPADATPEKADQES